MVAIQVIYPCMRCAMSGTDIASRDLGSILPLHTGRHLLLRNDFSYQRAHTPGQPPLALLLGIWG
eukprot:484035-Rhodomonas_salina.3